MFPAGSRGEIRAGSNDLEIERYWDFAFSEPTSPPSAPEQHEELDRLFRQAVERQALAEVAVGSHLSGGIDSGAITAIASESVPGLPTFTVGFDMTSASGLELGTDERFKAEALAYRFGTSQFETVLKAGDMERCLPALIWHLEDLRVGQSYPNYYANHLASKFVKVVFSGAGGDELFAGYPWRYYRAVVNDSFDDYAAKYYGFWNRLIPDEVRPRVLRPGLLAEAGSLDTASIMRGVLDGIPAPRSPEDYVNASMYLEAKTFLHGLLVVEDKLSMAHGVEVRLPFLDNDLVDFALTVPVGMKLRQLGEVVALNENTPGPKTEMYFNRTRDGKMILRDVLGRYVPEETALQVKQGFSGPDDTWFRGDSLDFVRRTLWNDDAMLYEYLDPDGIRSIVDEHLRGEQNHRLLLWSLLCLETWCRTFLAGSAVRP
jgi:asparagine synthase (glutamine-hydrolysing)